MGAGLVCMDRWMDGWMDGWMGGWMDGWVDGWVDVLWMHRSVHVLLDLRFGFQMTTTITNRRDNKQTSISKKIHTHT